MKQTTEQQLNEPLWIGNRFTIDFSEAELSIQSNWDGAVVKSDLRVSDQRLVIPLDNFSPS